MARVPENPINPPRPPLDRGGVNRRGPFAAMGAPLSQPRPPFFGLSNGAAPALSRALNDEATEHLRQLVAHFEAEWALGRQPWVDNYLASSPLPRPVILGVLLPIDLTRRLDAGEIVRMADYLKRYPELDDASAADLAFHDYCLRRQTGKPVSQAEYCVQLPWLAADLTRRFAASGFHDSVPTSLEPRVHLAGRFEFIEKLGEGEMGQVWRVRHRYLDRDRAVKLIRPSVALNDETSTRMLREARALDMISHPHTVTVHDVATAPVPYIEMEFVPGHTLDKILQAGVPMPLEWTARILDQLCDVLQVAHDHGIVHRDLKPTNLILVDGHPPGDEFLKVLDFGIAKFLGGGPETLTLTGHALGTAVYMSPEQVDNAAAVNVTSDIYTVGVILYELLTGLRPFATNGSLPRICDDILHQPAPAFRERNPEVEFPEGVEALVLRCLEKSPRDRPQGARVLAEEFRRLTRPPTAGANSKRGVVLDRRVAILGLLAAVAPSCLAAWYLLSHRDHLAKPAKPLEIVPPAHWSHSEGDGSGLVKVDGRLFPRQIERTFPDGSRVVALLVPRARADDPPTFYILRDKVSVAQFARFVAENPGAISSTAWKASDSRLPVMNVSGVSASDFATWLGGARTGFLPTPQQWLRAAGAGLADAREGPFVGTWNPAARPRIAVGNLKAPLPTERDDTDDVSPLLCRDMSGNGLEWTRFAPSAEAREPRTVLLLGESYREDAPFTFARARRFPNRQYIEDSRDDVGFRMVIEIVPESKP